MSLPESGEAPGEGGGAQEEVFGVRVPALVLLKKYCYTMGICSRAQETQIGALYQPRGVGWGGEGDGRELQKGGVVCIPMADSC